MNNKRVKRYDRSVIQDFCMGKSPSRVYESLEHISADQRISRSTVYRLYRKWVKEGKPGELVYVGKKEIDGRVIMMYKRKGEE